MNNSLTKARSLRSIRANACVGRRTKKLKPDTSGSISPPPSGKGQIPHPREGLTRQIPYPRAQKIVKCPGYARGGGGMLKFRIDRRIILTASWKKIYSVLGGVAKQRSPIRNIFSFNAVNIMPYCRLKIAISFVSRFNCFSSQTEAKLIITCAD